MVLEMSSLTKEETRKETKLLPFREKLKLILMEEEKQHPFLPMDAQGRREKEKMKEKMKKGERGRWFSKYKRNGVWKRGEGERGEEQKGKKRLKKRRRKSGKSSAQEGGEEGREGMEVGGRKYGKGFETEGEGEGGWGGGWFEVL